MYRVEIRGANSRQRLEEVESLVGHNRLYRRGTDRELLLDCREASEANLLAVNLGLIPGVQARALLHGE